MTRLDFMNQLEKLLGDISESERLEALDYYNGYFEDAGPENESQIIQELGSPGKVAAIIKADLAEDSGDYSEYSEKGYSDTRMEDDKVPSVYEGKADNKDSYTYTGSNRTYTGSNRSQRGYQAPAKKNSSGNLVLIIIILVVSSVVWIPVVLGLFSLLIGIVAALFGAFVAVVGVGFSGLVAGVFVIVKGILQCFTNPGLGLLEIGTGLVGLAIGILCILAVILIAARFFPWLIRVSTNFCQRILHRVSKKGEAS